jgi:hypothetical protein
LVGSLSPAGKGLGKSQPQCTRVHPTRIHTLDAQKALYSLIKSPDGLLEKPTLTDLLLAAGPADRALPALEAASLPRAARDLATRLAAAIAAIRARSPTLRLTVDPVEFRGFRYETGVSVTIYAPGRHEELGRGGRYICGEAEPATGLTLFPMPCCVPRRRPSPARLAPRRTVCSQVAVGQGGQGCRVAPHTIPRSWRIGLPGFGRSRLRLHTLPRRAVRVSSLAPHLPPEKPSGGRRGPSGITVGPSR